MSVEFIERFEHGFRSGTGFRPGTEMVRPLVSPSARQQLAESFGMRNSENYPIPELKIDDIVLFNVEELDESIKRAPRQWRSYSRFSRPAYSSEDQALVYATFQTSQGQGWFFLLERRAGEWHVQSVAPVWMG